MRMVMVVVMVEGELKEKKGEACGVRRVPIQIIGGSSYTTTLPTYPLKVFDGKRRKNVIRNK